MVFVLSTRIIRQLLHLDLFEPSSQVNGSAGIVLELFPKPPCSLLEVISDNVVVFFSDRPYFHLLGCNNKHSMH